MRVTAQIAVLLLAFTLFTPAQAADKESFPANLENILHTLLRFGAIDIKDDALIDNYARLTECDLFRKYYSNDFEWNKVRSTIRESIGMNVKSYPTAFNYNVEVQLDRYDFKNKMFPIASGTSLKNVNAFSVATPASSCVEFTRYIPRTFRFVLDIPVSVLGIPMSEKDAQGLLAYFNSTNNEDRLIYGKFNLRVVYIGPLRRVDKGEGNFGYAQPGTDKDTITMRIDAQLDTIDFYRDRSMKELIYTYVVP